MVKLRNLLVILLGFALVATSVIRVGLVNENRSEIRELFQLRVKQEQLLKENNSLVLEQSVLTRAARLQQVARDKLGMGKPRQVRQLRAHPGKTAGRQLKAE